MVPKMEECQGTVQDSTGVGEKLQTGGVTSLFGKCKLATHELFCCSPIFSELKLTILHH